MAWKVERWLSDVFPGEARVYEEYRHLPRRELAVVAASVLDLALAELISMRLLDLPKEYEEFLGLNEDGRAPVATFGARIQLALLLGIITDHDAAILRTIKNIRNKFAHRVRVDFTSDEVKPLMIGLWDKWSTLTKKLFDGGFVRATPELLAELRQYLEMTPDAGAGLLLAVFTTYQAYFHQLSAHVIRIESFSGFGKS